MKKIKFFQLSNLVFFCIGFIAILFSCDNLFKPESSTYSVDFSNFPDDCTDCTLMAYAYKYSDDSWVKTNTFELGSISSTTEIINSVDISDDATELDVVIFNNAETPKYYISINLTKVTDKEVKNSFWIDYQYYKYHSKIRFGINSSSVESMELGQSLNLDFTNAPYYIYKLDDAKLKKIRITVGDNSTNTNIYQTDSFSEIVNHTAQSVTLDDSTADISPTSDILYIFIVQSDYTQDAFINIEIKDYTDELAVLKSQYFDATDAISFDDNIVYLISRPSYSWIDSDPNIYILKKWDIDNNSVTDIKTFYNPVNVFIKDGSNILIGAGTNLYSYNVSNDVATKKVSFGGNLQGICIYNNMIIVYANQFYLLDKDNFSTLATKSDVYSGKVLIPIPSQGRFYFYRDGLTPNDICYQEINDDNTFGDDGDSPYHGDYSFPYPLKQFGAKLQLVTGNGNIFSIDDDESLSKIKYIDSLGIDVSDILFLSDRILVLVTKYTNSTVDSCYILSLNITSPYTEISRSTSFMQEKGIKLLQTQTGVIVISQATKSTDMFKKSYYPIHIRKIATSALDGSQANLVTTRKISWRKNINYSLCKKNF